MYFSQLAHSFRRDILELNQNKYKTGRYDKVLNKKKKPNKKSRSFREGNAACGARLMGQGKKTVPLFLA